VAGEPGHRRNEELADRLASLDAPPGGVDVGRVLGEEVREHRPRLPAGIDLVAHGDERVGSPMPRFTYSPSRSSAAARIASRSGGSPVGPPSRTERSSMLFWRPTAIRIWRSTPTSRWVVVFTTRSTKMPGVTTASGSSEPVADRCDDDPLADARDQRDGAHGLSHAAGKQRDDLEGVAGDVPERVDLTS
jgi:hypothetical protein